MRDRNELIDAILTAFDRPDYEPVFQDGKLVTTYCNLFVNEVARRYGCNDLYDAEKKRPRTADEIYDYVASHPMDWQEIQCATLQAEFQEIALTSAQFWANSGHLVLAVAKSSDLEGSHGHVCIIRPGTMKPSGKWGKAPAVANVGRENFVGIAKEGPLRGQVAGLNQAFRKMPRIFAWKGL